MGLLHVDIKEGAPKSDLSNFLGTTVCEIRERVTQHCFKLIYISLEL